MNIERAKITTTLNRHTIKRLQDLASTLRLEGYKASKVRINRIIEALALINEEEALRLLKEKIQ